MKNQKNDKWTAEKSVTKVEKMLNKHGWHLIPKKKTGYGIIIDTVKPIEEVGEKNDVRKD